MDLAILYIVLAILCALSTLFCLLFARKAPAYLQRGREQLETALNHAFDKRLEDAEEKANVLMEEATDLLSNLRSETARARAMIRHHGNKEEPEDSPLANIVTAAAAKMGLDPQKLLAGDPAEVQKAQQAIQGLQPKQQYL